MAEVMDVEVTAALYPDTDLAEREELTERGVVEKVVHPAHGAMESRIITRLFSLGVPAERIFSNVRLTRNPNGTRYVPDVLVVRDTNPVQPDPHADYAGAPDLVVEILSGGAEDRERDLIEKRQAYAARGVPHYWIADPDALTVADGYRQDEWTPLDRVVVPW